MGHIPPVNAKRCCNFPSSLSDFDCQLPIGVTLCRFGFSPGIGSFISPASVLTKFLSSLCFIHPDLPPLGSFVSPFHHSPFACSGKQAGVFTFVSGSCGSLGSVNSYFPLESFVHTNFKAVAKPILTKTFKLSPLPRNI
jgi:hypothetical protein